MTSKTYVSFYLKDGKVHIFADVIRDLGSPNYVRFLLNHDGSSMIMEPYHKKEFQSIRVPKDTKRNTKKMQFRCRLLCRLMQNVLGWQPDQSYRIPGRFIPSQGVAIFDMTKAEIINGPASLN